MKNQKNSQSINIQKSKNVKIGDININTDAKEKEENVKPQLEIKDTKAVQNFIAEGKTKKAIEEVLKIFKSIPENYEIGIILLNRLNRIETENRLGVINSNDKNLELNKINKSVLELIRK